MFFHISFDDSGVSGQRILRDEFPVILFGALEIVQFLIIQESDSEQCRLANGRMRNAELICILQVGDCQFEILIGLDCLVCRIEIKRNQIPFIALILLTET